MRNRTKLHPLVSPHKADVVKNRFKVKNLVKPAINIWSEAENGIIEDKVWICELGFGKEDYINTQLEATFHFTSTEDDDEILDTVIANVNQVC